MTIASGPKKTTASGLMRSGQRENPIGDPAFWYYESLGDEGGNRSDWPCFTRTACGAIHQGGSTKVSISGCLVNVERQELDTSHHL